MSNADKIFFISRNNADFSVNTKNKKEELHADIKDALKLNGLEDIIIYRNSLQGIFEGPLLEEVRDGISIRNSVRWYERYQDYLADALEEYYKH